MQVKNNQIELRENTFKVEFNTSDIELSLDKISISIGYPKDQLPNHFKDILKGILSETKDRLDMEAGYTIRELVYSKVARKGIIVDDIFFNTDRIVTSQLKKSTNSALFLCTIGSKMEEWSKQKNIEGDILGSYLIDTVASEAVELLADLLHEHIKVIVKENDWYVTNRYSPGYCNWNVSEQQKLFSFFPDDFCNVKLSESSLMMPIKSISGIIGLGSDSEYNEYLCDRCGIKDCTHRIYLNNKRKIKSKIN